MARKKRKKALVLGIGNLLLKDEGLGVRAAELFKRDYSFG
jgi:Ni,Fe-hydrogenase maturation factor